MTEWISEHVLEAVVLLSVGGASLIQISPLKFNPWTILGQAFGRFIGVSAIRDTLEEHIRIDDERNIKQCRMRVLRFSDEILQGKQHTKEHFDEILEDITEYTRYCRVHKDFENSKAIMAIDNVKKTYQRCQAEKTFL